MDEDLEQLVVTRIRDDQVSIQIEDDPLWIDQSVDQDEILVVLGGDHMDGIIADRRDIIVIATDRTRDVAERIRQTFTLWQFLEVVRLDDGDEWQVVT
jgi:hypothetical protein